MSKLSKNEQGFSIVELIMVIVIVILIGTVGYFVYKNHQPTKAVTLTKTVTKTPAPAANAPTAANPYAGWASYTLQNEKSTFQYPTSWKAVNTGATDGQDMIELTAPDGYYVNIQTVNLGHPSLDSPTTIIDSVPLTFVGQSGFINYFSVADASSSTGISINAELSMTSTSVFGSLFPTKNLNPSGYYSINLGNKSTPISLDNIKNDTNGDFSNTKLVIESIKY